MLHDISEGRMLGKRAKGKRMYTDGGPVVARKYHLR